MTMGTFIVKLPHATRPYIEYSTIVDAPATRGLTRDELVAHYREEYGERGVAALDARIARADEYGTSSLMGAPGERSARDEVALNRAGKGETCLTLEQLTEFFCEHGGRGEPPLGHKHDDSDSCSLCWPKQ
jgi:hypothetical protein